MGLEAPLHTPADLGTELFKAVAAAESTRTLWRLREKVHSREGCGHGSRIRSSLSRSLPGQNTAGSEA